MKGSQHSQFPTTKHPTYKHMGPDEYERESGKLKEDVDQTADPFE